MFKRSLIKYVKLLDTPFLVSAENGNGKDQAEGVVEERVERERRNPEERDIEELEVKRRELESEIVKLENKLKELSLGAEEIVKAAKREAEGLKSKLEGEAKRSAERLVAEAKKEAETIREKAFNEGYKEGYDKGFSQGYKEGLEKGRAEYDELIALLRSVIEGIKASKERILEEIEPEVIEILKIVLRKLLLREVALDEDLVLRVIKAAMKKLEERSRIVVRVNPEDLPKAVSRREELFQSVEGLKELEFVEDPRVGRGGCIVEGGLGVVDARIGRQIEEVERFIDKLLREGREEDVA